jgi:hypothetical protein
MNINDTVGIVSQLERTLDLHLIVDTGKLIGALLLLSFQCCCFIVVRAAGSGEKRDAVRLRNEAASRCSRRVASTRHNRPRMQPGRHRHCRANTVSEIFLQSR